MSCVAKRVFLLREASVDTRSSYLPYRANQVCGGGPPPAQKPAELWNLSDPETRGGARAQLHPTSLTSSVALSKLCGILEAQLPPPGNGQLRGLL